SPYANYRVQAPHGPEARLDQHHARVSDRYRRSLLSDTGAGERGPLSTLRGAGRPDAWGELYGAARDLPLLQHGPGGRPEPHLVRTNRPDDASPAASSNRIHGSTRSRSAGAGVLGALRSLRL